MSATSFVLELVADVSRTGTDREGTSTSNREVTLTHRVELVTPSHGMPHKVVFRAIAGVPISEFATGDGSTRTALFSVGSGSRSPHATPRGAAVCRAVLSPTEPGAVALWFLSAMREFPGAVERLSHVAPIMRLSGSCVERERFPPRDGGDVDTKPDTGRKRCAGRLLPTGRAGVVNRDPTRQHPETSQLRTTCSASTARITLIAPDLIVSGPGPVTPSP